MGTVFMQRVAVMVSIVLVAAVAFVMTALAYVVAIRLFPPRVGLVFWLWQCDKENHGWREGHLDRRCQVSIW
ncbi:MAG TPA: hypothetical protein VN924_26430 [Bryobacteraceae bacterium]|nr:hypothetical protein [Bryobacteraceae bacterium]